MEELLKRSQVFCLAPWTNLTVRADGGIFPCCVADLSLPVGRLGDRTLAEAWDGEALRRIRRDMLAGRESPGCRWCYDEERWGTCSLRQSLNTRLAGHFPLVAATREDGSLARLNLACLDLTFSNECNFRCRICGPHNSSAWYADAQRIGILEEGRTDILRAAGAADLVRQIEPLLPGVEEIHLSSGGEPLITEEHRRLIVLLVEKKLFHVRLSYNTNFSTLTHGGSDFAELWDQFETVRVVASLDGMGRRGEYLRKGQDWEQAVRNRRRMLAVCPRVEFSLAPTLCAMNALHLPDLHQAWCESGFIAPEAFRLNILRVPRCYSLVILPGPLKDRVAQRYRAYGAALPAACGSLRLDLQAATNFMLGAQDAPSLEMFRSLTRRLDRIRGEDFAEVFPELAELLGPPSREG
ncbi:MAG: twitch domain-containing radical SAM protein [Elusimicrobia bacterium]|nr:twitch domain-containing radical SAM protein [Elusimicrobiota bacterium]